MLLVLNDAPNKSMVNMTSTDADFVRNNLERILVTFEVLGEFLRASYHEEWFKSANISAMPLYFLAYHIFHKSEDPNHIRQLSANFNANDTDFQKMSLWLKLSLLNKAFSRGCGWNPTTTGMKNIHAIMKANRRGFFPLSCFLIYTIKVFTNSSTEKK